MSSSIETLQARLTQALERIGSAVDGWEPAPAVAEPTVDPAEIEDLRTQLDDEKLAYAQLEERNRVLQEKLDAALEPTAPAPEPPPPTPDADALASLDAELQRLRKANEALRETCEALREASAKGVAEPHLINKAMLSELEAMRAARAADASETRAVMETLAPLLAVADAQGAVS